VNANSILDINQSLCDDNLVDTDKIGGSKYFWSFPAKNDRLKQLEHDETLKRIEGLVGAIKEAEVKLADAKRGREEEEQGSNGDEEGKPTTRASKMARRSELTKAVADKSAELEKLKENDPQAIADLEKELNLVTQAATRWTDNIFACQEVRIVRSCCCIVYIYILPAFCVCVIVIIVHMRSPIPDNNFNVLQYMVKKRGMVKKEVNKMIGITDAFDCEFLHCVHCFVVVVVVVFCLIYYILRTLQCCMPFFMLSPQTLTPSKRTLNHFYSEKYFRLSEFLEDLR